MATESKSYPFEYPCEVCGGWVRWHDDFVSIDDGEAHRICQRYSATETVGNPEGSE